MPISIPVVVPPIPEPGAPALRVTLPGGLVVEGVAETIGANKFTQARALIASANAALAPLGPVFTLIDALLSVKDFAQAVPEVVVNPGSVIEAIAKLVQKIGRLTSLVPQLSVPVMIVGVIDAVIALLEGLIAELEQIEEQETRIDAVVDLAATLPPGAAAPLLTITVSATATLEVRRTDLAAALASVQPLINILNIFAGLAGLPSMSVSGDVSTEALSAVIDVLSTLRASIPV